MKKLPFVYRLNCVGGALIIFVLVRSGIPPLFHRLFPGAPLPLLLAVYSAILIASCLLPVIFIENMCDFRPDLLTVKPLKAENFAITRASMSLFVFGAALNRGILRLLEKTGLTFPARTLQPASGPTLIFYFFYVAVIPAFFEEFFVRGTVLGLVRDGGRRFAVLFSALVFTVMHTTIQNFLPVFLAGVVLGCVYVYTGNIYASVLLHFTNNAYSFLMMYFSSNYSGLGDLGLSAFLISLVLAAGAAGLICVVRQRLNFFSPLGEGGRKLVSVFRSPVLILGILFCLRAGISRARETVAG